jgi:hypothetical protein
MGYVGCGRLSAMERAFVKKNIGRKFVVALVGHDHGAWVRQSF